MPDVIGLFPPLDVKDHLSGLTINRNRVAGSAPIKNPVDFGHRGNPKGAGQNGRVRVVAPLSGDDAANPAALQEDRVRRKELICYDHCGIGQPCERM